MFFSLLASPRHHQADWLRRGRLGDFRAELRQVFCLLGSLARKKLRRGRLFECLLSDGDRIISTDEMFYGSKI